MMYNEERWIDENGLQKDEEQLALALRQKMEGENKIPQRNVTAEEVKDMIDTALSDSNSNNSTTIVTT